MNTEFEEFLKTSLMDFVGYPINYDTKKQIVERLMMTPRAGVYDAFFENNCLNVVERGNLKKHVKLI